MKRTIAGSSTTLRFAVLGVLGLAMLIPLAMVEGVSNERQHYFESTVSEVAAAWGEEQTLSGPFLVVPETRSLVVESDQGETLSERVDAERILLPEVLVLQVDIRHEIRKRAIYQVPVYTAIISVQGRFPAFSMPEGAEVRLDQARLAVGISHTQAISDATPLRFGDAAYAFGSGTGQSWIGPGVQAALPGYDGESEVPFSFEITLRGTRQFGFAAVGGRTSVQMDATWPHPGFGGRYLPEHRQIDADGFSARWSVHELARNLPGQFLPGQASPPDIAWVRLFQPVTQYTNVDRAIKYGLLFVAMTFLTFICFELVWALQFHVVQYGVVGAGLALFYLLLLALSEHLSFGISYLVATLLLTTLIGAYVRGITASGRAAAWISVIMLSLFGTLYVLLILETYALLLGAGVLLAGLAALMAATRNLSRRA